MNKKLFLQINQKLEISEGRTLLVNLNVTLKWDTRFERMKMSESGSVSWFTNSSDLTQRNSRKFVGRRDLIEMDEIFRTLGFNGGILGDKVSLTSSSRASKKLIFHLG